MKLNKRWRLLSLLLSMAMVAAACSSDGDSTDASADGGGDSEQALAGQSYTVGSKDFTENILLGKMLAIALEDAGASVDDKTNLGGTSVNREALLSGDIDVYPDYNGTGWTVHLGESDPSFDSAELSKNVAEADLAKNNIYWSEFSPFNDTYGFVANGDLAEANGGGFDMQGMADYMAANPDTVLCLETEFPDRPDGLVLFEEDTGFQVPASQIQILETGVIYTETASGSCDFGEVFTTDGRIAALNLALVSDDGTFILYNAGYSWANDVFSANGDVLNSMMNTILEPLDETTMAALNAEVDVDGKTYDVVARQYLVDQGIISG